MTDLRRVTLAQFQKLSAASLSKNTYDVVEQKKRKRGFGGHPVIAVCIPWADFKALRDAFSTAAEAEEDVAVGLKVASDLLCRR